MKKDAITDLPLNDLIASRWSPRAFGPEPVTPTQVRTLMEAARWAASAFNGQPWAFIVATKDDPEGFATALSCLVEFNQSWVSSASVIILTFSARHPAGGRANAYADHDLGLAASQLVLQATALGLASHQMAGIVADRIKEVYGVPEGFAPMTAIAIGHPGDPDTLPEQLAERERAPRERKPQSEFVFSGAWGKAL